MKTKAVPLSSELSLPLPAEIQVLPFGLHRTEQGAFRLDEAGAKTVIEDFESRKNDMVIDYEHQTLGGGEAPAAGWIKKLVSKGKEGLWAAVEWTPRAVEYLKNREYRYLSPVFLKRLSDDRVVKLINAALTNQPAIDGMAPVVNRAPASGAKQYQTVIPAKAGIQKIKKEASVQRLMELLGLPEDATEEQAMEAVSVMKEGTALREKEYAALLALKAEVAALKSEAAKRDADELVDLAMKEGKVTPAQRDWAMGYAERDPEGFGVFVAKAPVVVPMAEITPPSPLNLRGETGELQASVNRLLGIDAGATGSSHPIVKRKHNSKKEV